MANAFASLTDYLRRWVDASPVAGMVIVVTDRRQTLYSDGFGYADLASRQPVRLDTTFQIGSIGKSMTALAVLQLAQSGRLDLNAPASTHLPWFAMPSRYGPITLRHLLSHTAGLPAGADFTPAARYEGFALRETEAAWPPGSRFHYSNTGYKLLGWLLEDVTGMDYGSVIRERVLEPLGMDATDPVITHELRLRTASGYVPARDDRPYRQNEAPITAPWFEYAVADGSQISTIGDMAKYARVFLNGGRCERSALVSPYLYQQMTTPVIDMSRGDGFGYGYGVIGHHADGHDFIGHGGSTVGFRSIMITDQTDGLGVVILCNGFGVDTYDPARYALRVAAAVRDGQPLPEPPAIPDPTRISGAQRYAGEYAHESTGATLSVRAHGDNLTLEGGGFPNTAMEHVAGNTFCVPDDRFDPFPVRFWRADGGEEDAPMVEIHHGPDVYLRRGASPLAETEDYPREWSAFPGHYRSHAPYVSGFRVILRRGRLYLAWPSGGEEPLTQNPADARASPRFLVGPIGEPTAEWVRFDAIVGNRALRAQWAGGGNFYRV